MKIAENIIKEHIGYFSSKNILEIACGEASMSLEASKYAKHVLASDIEDYRLKRLITIPDNFSSMVVDAKDLESIDYNPDTIFCFNGLGHMQEDLVDILEATIKKVSKSGHILFFSSWKMDRNVSREELLPLLTERADIKYACHENKKYDTVIISLA